jgi:D-xylonolactonase
VPLPIDLPVARRPIDHPFPHRPMSASVPRLLETPRCVWPAAAALGEGTCWSAREQALWWVDILGQQLHRYTPASGEQRSWAFAETISAVAERAHAPGLLVTLRRGFALFDPATGALRRLEEPEPERPLNRFNDGKCDGAGRFWAGTMDFDCRAPTGALYRFDPTPDAGPDRIGRVVRALDPGFAITNGPTWSRDGRTMYFTDTLRGEISAFDFEAAAGTLSNQRLWLRFGHGDGKPDGMTTDAAGRIWIAHWGAACVTCREPASGAELLRVRLPASQITNVAFGGAGLDMLYITSARSGLSAEGLQAEPLAGALFALKTDARGCAPGLFAG